MMNEYTPEIDGKYAKVVIALEECSSCGKSMVKVREEDTRRLSDLFPLYIKDNLKSQLERAGIQWLGYQTDKFGECLCEECSKAGKGKFICALCNEERSSNLIERCFGYPPEYLCRTCYVTVPAKQWDIKVKELHDSHRWDFE